MKNLWFRATVLVAIIFGILYFLNRRFWLEDPAALERSRGAPSASDSVKGVGARGSAEAGNSDRFATEVIPVLNDFLTRVESLDSVGIRSPLDPPITRDQSTKIRFAGGPSNTICTFVVGDHCLVVCHLINRGKEIRGVNTFRRTGTDETGMPRNIIQLTEEPTKNEQYIRRLSDTREYPARDLQEVAALAQRALAALLPQDSASYRLNESWREQVGSTALPYYTFAFVRKGPAGPDPSNLMRDEIMIGFKSTKSGLVLDSFEDNSIAFIGKKN